LQVLFYFKRELGLDAVSVAALSSALLTIVSVLLGAKYQMGKSKAKQLSDLLATMIVAAEDDEIAEEEFQKIVAQAKALLDPGRLEG
jgi:hypothetical protein